MFYGAQRLPGVCQYRLLLYAETLTGPGTRALVLAVGRAGAVGRTCVPVQRPCGPGRSTRPSESWTRGRERVMEPVEEFLNNDQAYQDWLGQHPDGFVLDCYRHRPQSYMMLHHARCEKINKPKSTDQRRGQHQASMLACSPGTVAMNAFHS